VGLGRAESDFTRLRAGEEDRAGRMMNHRIACGGLAFAAGIFSFALLLLGVHARADVPTATPAPTAQPATQPTTLFDPAVDMPVAEVKIGMKGYGLSVFSGDKIEKFDCEVVDVVQNFDDIPSRYVVLIQCPGAYLQHTGAIAGMSGSPIYLFDPSDTARAHPKLVGAFAYGWPLAKDCLAGVQPAEYMLALPADDKRQTTTAPAPMPAAGAPAMQIAPLNWQVLQGVKELQHPRQPRAGWYGIPGLASSGLASSGSVSSGSVSPGSVSPVFSAMSPRDGIDGPPMQLQPLATPMIASGLSSRALQQLAPMYAQYGMVLLDSPGESALGGPPADLAPGSVFACPVLIGDLDLTAIGTTTAVVGDRVFAFGHPFNNEGRIALPLGSGRISTVVANLATSFKLGAMTQIRGTLQTDEQVGVAGRIGKAPPMIPIAVHIVYTDGSIDDTYHFQSVIHPKFTPLASTSALAAAIAGHQDLPEFQTLDYDIEMDFANGKTVHLKDRSSDSGLGNLIGDLGVFLSAASDNPFERVNLAKMDATVTVSDQSSSADIVNVTVPREKYRPGETVRALVTYRPFRAGESVLPVDMDLPKNLPDGKYTLSISDADSYLRDQQQAEPFQFTAQSVDDVFAVLDEVSHMRHNALYVRLVRQADGVAVGRTAMPTLPSSVRQVLLDSGRTDVTAFTSSNVKVIPTDLVFTGSASFSITVDRDLKLDIATSGHATSVTPAGAQTPSTAP
jgi:hypothetical protein